MAKTRIKLDRKGVRELLQSEDMMLACEEQANKAASKLGDGYTVTTHIGKTRVNAEIAASTREAIADQKKNNTILKALG